MAVHDRFQTLLSGIQPTQAELATYEGHMGTVGRRLATSFPGTRVELIGSHSRGTAIAGASDLDLMAHVPRDVARRAGDYITSDRLIAKVKAELVDRYYATDIRKDAQAIVLNFRGGNYNVDVVPSVFHTFVDVAGIGAQRPVYLIPNGRGDWLPTSPQAHDAYLREEDRRSTGKLKYTAQLIKFWRQCRMNVDLQSFHVELVLATEGVCVGPKSYARCLQDAFRSLAARRCRALQDPIGIAGLVPAANSEAKIEAAAAAVENAAYHAQLAVRAEDSGDLQEAYRQWSIVFRDAFPRR